MGLTVKNKNNYDLKDNVANFFSLNNEEVKEDYNDLKEKIYALDIDNEEKANILNIISNYSNINSFKEKNKLKKEIDKFIDKYNL